MAGNLPESLRDLAARRMFEANPCSVVMAMEWERLPAATREAYRRGVDAAWSAWPAPLAKIAAAVRQAEVAFLPSQHSKGAGADCPDWPRDARDALAALGLEATTPCEAAA